MCAPSHGASDSHRVVGAFDRNGRLIVGRLGNLLRHKREKPCPSTHASCSRIRIRSSVNCPINKISSFFFDFSVLSPKLCSIRNQSKKKRLTLYLNRNNGRQQCIVRNLSGERAFLWFYGRHIGECRLGTTANSFG